MRPYLCFLWHTLLGLGYWLIKEKLNVCGLLPHLKAHSAIPEGSLCGMGDSGEWETQKGEDGRGTALASIPNLTSWFQGGVWDSACLPSSQVIPTHLVWGEKISLVAMHFRSPPKILCTDLSYIFRHIHMKSKQLVKYMHVSTLFLSSSYMKLWSVVYSKNSSTKTMSPGL